MEYKPNDHNNPESQPNSFGIEKVVDCRMEGDGRQMYKVRWECTWEPAENLAGCQHLVDDFWSLINKAKMNETVAKQCRQLAQQRSQKQSNMNLGNFGRLSNDDKADVQNLIARANATSVGSSGLQSPSNSLSLSNSQNNFMRTATTPTYGDHKNFNPSQSDPDHKGFSHKSLTFQSMKTNMEVAVSKPKSSNNSTLKYIENFENPYVKIILVCKACNKEQSMKFAHNWKTHYLSHVSDAEKPHKCTYCPKAFITAPQLKKHLKQHEKDNVSVKNESFKTEMF